MTQTKKETIMKTTKLFAIALTLIISGCSGVNTKPPQMGGELVWYTHEDRPEWVVVPPYNEDGDKQFVGISYRHGSEKSARQSAMTNAAAEVIRHAKQNVTKDLTQQSVSTGQETQMLETNVTITDIERVQAEGLLKDLRTVDYYAEQWHTGEGTFFKAYVLVEMTGQAYEKLHKYTN